MRWADRNATDLSVWLNGKSSIPLPAVLEPNFDSTLDLAVIRVEGMEAYGIQSENTPFDRLGNPNDRIRGDYVFPMGNPLGRHWAISFEPDRFAGREGDRLYFESSFVAPGHSGGALWDEDLRLIGMIRRDRPPHGEALSITAVLARVMQWGYPVQLKQHLDGVIFRRVSAGGEHTCAVPSRNWRTCSRVLI